MWSWFEREVIDRGRLPLFLALLAFVVTFVVTRAITRMIRSGRGPFHDHVLSSGTHIHHAVPGVLILMVGAFIGISSQAEPWWTAAAALLVGCGTSLVLDEFALLLRLDDVYWSEEGRISVEVVALAAGLLGLAIVFANPFNLDDAADQSAATGTVVFTLLLHVFCVGVCVAKGKYRLALLGAFIPTLAFIGSIRLARPNSTWAKRWYTGKKLDRALRRGAKFDARYGHRLTWAYDFVGGRPEPVANPRH